MLEQGTMEVLREAGVGERMEREGLLHGGIYLCFDRRRHHIPMSELTGGRGVMIHGQTEVVKDLIAARLQVGAPLRFECEQVTVEGVEQGEPSISYLHGGRRHELRCDIVAGCDGFHGVCRTTISPERLTCWQREYPYAWLGILADVASSTDELIYAYCERGFALHSMSSLTLGRLHIQGDPSERIDSWPDARIWEELQLRLASDGWQLTEGPVLEKSITPMRSFVAAPMRRRRGGGTCWRALRSTLSGCGPTSRRRRRAPGCRRRRRRS